MLLDGTTIFTRYASQTEQTQNYDKIENLQPECLGSQYMVFKTSEHRIEAMRPMSLATGSSAFQRYKLKRKHPDLGHPRQDTFSLTHLQRLLPHRPGEGRFAFPCLTRLACLAAAT
jgi:hypothetical protein